MAAGLELDPSLLSLHFDQTGEEQDHVAALVKNGRVAVVAANLAGEFVLDGLATGVVPLEVVVAVDEVDVGFVEDCCPLEGSGCWRCSVSGESSRMKWFGHEYGEAIALRKSTDNSGDEYVPC